MYELVENEDGGSTGNFRIIYQLNAGETYYIKAKFYNNEMTGSFDVYAEARSSLTKMELISAPTNTTYIKDYFDSSKKRQALLIFSYMLRMLTTTDM